MDKTVFAVRCPDYDQVGGKISELMARMGGIGSYVSAGEKIVLKANLLLPAGPEKAVTTHPAVLNAAGKVLLDSGARPVIADSPGSGYRYNRKMLTRIYRTCGLDPFCREAGIELNFDFSSREVFYPEGELIKRFEVITPVLEADGVINVCKLKTHLFMHMTGAVKNSFGVIPGLTKPGYHAKLKDNARFAAMLLDLSSYVAPRLSIMDAVVAMEGEGPGSGEPRQVGLLLASTNPLALDVVAGEIMGIDRDRNTLLQEAGRRGMTPTRLEEVELVGLEKPGLRLPDFKLPSTIYGEPESGGFPWWLNLVAPLFKNGMTVKPVINRENCVACGSCYESCPEEAISLVDQEYAEIDPKKCIRCYCCHEMCRYDAVSLQKSLLYKLVNR
ncbi:MAG: DUF362 domain-containing protein [Desulfohalobiaceae bacterium]|nr:DUF362 domain-containing protein [Desulfohalobiaceae bacterium]